MHLGKQTDPVTVTFTLWFTEGANGLGLDITEKIKWPLDGTQGEAQNVEMDLEATACTVRPKPYKHSYCQGILQLNFFKYPVKRVF